MTCNSDNRLREVILCLDGVRGKLNEIVKACEDGPEVRDLVADAMGYLAMTGTLLLCLDDPDQEVN